MIVRAQKKCGPTIKFYLRRYGPYLDNKVLAYIWEALRRAAPSEAFFGFWPHRCVLQRRHGTERGDTADPGGPARSAWARALGQWSPSLGTGILLDDTYGPISFVEWCDVCSFAYDDFHTTLTRSMFKPKCLRNGGARSLGHLSGNRQCMSRCMEDAWLRAAMHTRG